MFRVLWDSLEKQVQQLGNQAKGESGRMSNGPP